MKRWTLLLFLLLLPFTMAPRTSLTPQDGLDVSLLASRTNVQPGDLVNVVGQVRNTGDAAVAAPAVRIYLRLDRGMEANLERRTNSGCEPMERGVVECSVRSLKPNQQAAFSFAVRFEGSGDVHLSTEAISATMPSKSVMITVTAPSTGQR